MIVYLYKYFILRYNNKENIEAGRGERPMSENKAKYQMNTTENYIFLKEIREKLLWFGHNFPSPGGSAYHLGYDGAARKELNRETWITSRMVHVYSVASLLNHSGSQELADAGLKGLMGELHDKEHGGWYAGVDEKGEALPDKQCYAHAFVILAASSAVLAQRPGAQELLKEALELYDLRFWNEEEGLSCDTWNRAFTVLDPYRGLNANMHTVEAFLAAADVTGDEKYRKRAGRIIDHVVAWASENEWRIPEHFSKDWKIDFEYNKEHKDDQFKPYGATPGHGIEWARLIVQWALSAYKNNNDASSAYIEAAQNLYCTAMEDAWSTDGAPGFVYTTDWSGKPIVHTRRHWTLAEAINTSAVLFRVTGKEKYANDYAEFMQYLDEKVLDHVYGSWFHRLDRKNTLAEGRCPDKPDLYHAVQATLIPYYAADLSIALAVKNRKVCS